MRAVTIREHGGPGVLRLEDRPDPAVGPGQVRLEVRACALNHLDLWVRQGLPNQRLTYPHILGSDIAGVVEAVGAGVEGIAAGARAVVAPGLSCGRCAECLSGRDHLCARFAILGEHRDGGYAELITVPAGNVMPLPGELSFVEAAAVPLVFLTAWQMLLERARLQRGETVLVLGAGSGVGTAAIQIGKLQGARVIAVSSSAAKLERARELGADHQVCSAEEDVLTAVRRLTQRKGVEVVFEHVGAATWETSIRACARGGRIVTCGATSGWDARTDLRHVFYRQLSILGSTLGSRALLFPILAEVQAGRLRPVVDRVLPLEQAAEAHRLLEARGQFGKIVLVPRG